MIKGFTCGAFDLLHAGHIVMFKEAKENCDYLIVGLQTDPSIDRQEKNQPVQTVYERFVQLQAVKYIDEISSDAKSIGAVNTIKISNNKLTGHNTDHIGFTKSIEKIDDFKRHIYLSKRYFFY